MLGKKKTVDGVLKTFSKVMDDLTQIMEEQSNTIIEQEGVRDRAMQRIREAEAEGDRAALVKANIGKLLGDES